MARFDVDGIFDFDELLNAGAILSDVMNQMLHSSADVIVKTQKQTADAMLKGKYATGRLVKADLTIQMASGKLFADDGLAESVEEFASGSIAMETDDMLDEVASVVYGAEVEDKLVHYNTKDDPPPGGLAYYKVLMRRKKKRYKGYFYPLVKAALGNDTAQTKADSITFGTTATTFTVFACDNGDWRQTEEFTDEAEALAWVKSRFAPADAGAAG